MEWDGARWDEARSWLIERVRAAVDAPVPKIPHLSATGVLRVMALASFADWIASDASKFPYGRNPSEPGYFDEAVGLARSALDQIGWWPKRPFVPRSFGEIFPFEPNPLQRSVPKLLAQTTAPVLLVVEAPMGTGKTEAALYAYHLLRHALDHRGLYVALPTQATANALFQRVVNFLRHLGESRLDAQLVHGTATLQPLYAELLENAHPTEVHDEPGGDPTAAAAGGVRAAAWFSARKRAMLAEHGVGTVDQALLGVLRVKHHFVRLFGLMNRVVVLDEVHAYDVYTSGLIESLLRWLRALGSSVVLMTATLPPSRRQRLLAAWAGGPVKEPNVPYPRVLALHSEGRCEVESLPGEHDRPLTLVRMSAEVDAIADRLRDALPGALGAIVNTVDRAQLLYRALGDGAPLRLGELLEFVGPRATEDRWSALRALADKRPMAIVGRRLSDGTVVLLLHARFPAEDRALREHVALALFGPGERPMERMVLVATQVAEQSLDLDFDWLYTDLAPVDLVLQRAGRLHRHRRGRPSAHDCPHLHLGVPPEDPAPDFATGLFWSRIYDEWVLLSTWWALRMRPAIHLPSDLEPLLVEVYERSPEDFPADLRARADDAYRRWRQQEQHQERLAANWSLRDLERLLDATSTAALPAQGRMDDDVDTEATQRLLTRLGDASVAVVPVFHVGEAWALDAEGRETLPRTGNLSKEWIQRIFLRAVRLSRYPLPQILAQEKPPRSWERVGLLRGLRPLVVGRVFVERDNRGLCVNLDPELGVVYERVLVRERDATATLGLGDPRDV